MTRWKNHHRSLRSGKQTFLAYTVPNTNALTKSINSASRPLLFMFLLPQIFPEMATISFIFFALLIITLRIQSSLGVAKVREFEIVNNCTYTVWLASPIASLALESQVSTSVDLPTGEHGRLWARTGCHNSTGKFVCWTGDCGSGDVACHGREANAATYVEFDLNDDENGPDFYDVSLVDGYNVPVSMVPKGGDGSTCVASGCIFNVTDVCPSELRVGGACQGACDAFNTSRYCCTGGTVCGPTNYSAIFKKDCPRASSYPTDLTFSCWDSPRYTVTFCPSSTSIVNELSTPFQPQLSPPPPSTVATKRAPPPLLLAPTLAPLVLPPRPGKGKKKRRSKVTVLVAVPTSTTILILFCLGIWIHRRKKKMTATKTAEIEDIRNMKSLQFDINTIIAATCNFSVDDKLGEGGFGEVYKGKLENGEEVAVKRLLQNSKQGVIEFKTEVVLVAKLQHKNLVKLLGFCMTPTEKILVYEFLPNSSLDKFLFDPTSNAPLDWQTRLNIIIGIARGLVYLHEDSRLTVIHRDLKTSNILLDGALNPKISDFGLAKLFGDDQTHGDTKRIVGTYGYMAPEYAITGQYSVKSDVYGFGVIVLEIISGKKNRFFGGTQCEEALLHQAWRLWNQSESLDFVDTRLNNDFPTEEVMRCFHIGLLCIQEDAIRRPTITSILDALSNPSTSLSDPRPPRFLGHPGINPEDHHSLRYTYTGTQTITELYSRD